MKRKHAHRVLVDMVEALVEKTCGFSGLSADGHLGAYQEALAGYSPQRGMVVELARGMIIPRNSRIRKKLSADLKALRGRDTTDFFRELDPLIERWARG